MSELQFEKSLWHQNCRHCEEILKNAELRRMNDAISDGIITLYSAAQMDLTQGLARCFGWNLAYDTLLDKVDELFAKHPSLVSHEVHSAIKFLQEQDKFYRQYRTFYSGHWLKPPYVKVIERIIESMKIIAGRLGLSNCVKKIGSLLYDVNGAEMQLLRGERVVVHRENSCATNQHLELSKIALFLAHSPPDSEITVAPSMQEYLDYLFSNKFSKAIVTH